MTHRILVVDDDRDLREVLRLTLESFGYETALAANGVEALARVAEQMPALILLDMKMPVMDGWDFAREFRRRHAQAAPVCIVSAAEDVRQRAAEIEADAYLGKPFDVRDLLAVVERALAGR